MNVSTLILAAVWQCVGPGGGGWIESMHFSRHAPDRLWIGCDVGGVYLSENAGRTYEMRSAGFKDLLIEDFAEHPTNPDVLIAVNHGIYKTTDRGRTWVEKRAGLPPPEKHSYAILFSHVAFDPQNPQRVFASVGSVRMRRGREGCFFYRSTDGGESWQSIVAPDQFEKDTLVFDFSLDPRDAEKIVATTSHGIYRSTDGGVHWASIRSALPAHGRCRRIARSAANPDVLYATFSQRCGEKPWNAGVYRSDDGGLTWQARNGGLSMRTGSSGGSDMLCDWYDCLVLHPQNADIAYLGGATWWSPGIWKTTDGGLTWVRITRRAKDDPTAPRNGWLEPPGHPTVASLTISPINPNRIAYGTDYLVRVTDDGGDTWRNCYTESRTDGKSGSIGLETTCVKEIVPDVAQPDRIRFAFLDIGVWQTADGGRTFEAKFVNDQHSAFSIAQSPTEPNLLWRISGDHSGAWNPADRILVSRDGGFTWGRIVTNAADWMRPHGHCLRCLNDAPPYRLAYCSGSGLAMSDDGAVTWRVVSTNECPFARRVATIKRAGRVIIAGTFATEYENGELWYSKDVGTTWKRAEGFPACVGSVGAIAVEGRTMLVGAGESYCRRTRGMRKGGAWLSKDGGRTWRQIRAERGVRSVDVSKGRLFIGLGYDSYFDNYNCGGVEMSIDDGITWRDLTDDSLVNRNVNAVLVDPWHPDVIWAATQGNAVFRRQIPAGTDFLAGLKDVDKGWHMTRPSITLRNLADDLTTDLTALTNPLARASYESKLRFMRMFVDERQTPEVAKRWRETFARRLDDGPTNRLWRTPAARAGRAGYVTAMTLPQKNGPLPQDPAWPTFSVSFDVDFTDVKAGETLAEIPGVCQLFFRMADTEKKLAGYDYNWGNYVNFRLPNGKCPVIEATMDVRGGRIGIPFGALANPTGRKKVLLVSRKGHWTILVDGVKDDETPGHPEPVALSADAQVKTLSPRVSNAAFVRGAAENLIPPDPDEKPITRPIQYWTPDAFNGWVGDVVVDTRGDRLHLFYLFDRRHHGGGGGRGGHYFAHISTTDLVHWVEHPLATEIENWWETHGTGTPFMKDGKYCLAFGYHTTRMVEYPRTTGPVELDWEIKHKWARRLFTENELVGRIPHGSTYAVSDDGIHFSKTGTIYDTDQNPSIYNLPDGRYLLAADRNLYTSTDFKTFEVFDNHHTARGDCPAYFTWNGRHYLIQGNDFFDSSATGQPNTWENWAKDGWYVSDGISVPMVANWKGNRRIVAGWIRHIAGWGGWLCFRELVAEPDGRLGMKWVPEMMPPEKPQVFHAKADEMFELRFHQTNGGKKKTHFSFRIDPKKARAQFADVRVDGSVLEIPTLADYHKNAQIFAKMPPIADRFNRMAYKPASADVFAQDNINVAGKDYEVRLICHEDPKSGCTIFDVEIDGRRTMVCRRWGKYQTERVN